MQQSSEEQLHKIRTGKQLQQLYFLLLPTPFLHDDDDVLKATTTLTSSVVYRYMLDIVTEIVEKNIVCKGRIL